MSYGAGVDVGSTQTKNRIDAFFEALEHAKAHPQARPAMKGNPLCVLPQA